MLRPFGSGGVVALCLRKDGSKFEVTVMESPMLDTAGAVVGLSVVMRETGATTSRTGRMPKSLNSEQDANQ